MHRFLAIAYLFTAVPMYGQANTPAPGENAISVSAATVAVTHVRVVDGSGAPAKEDQTIVIAGGNIQSIAAAGATQLPPGVLSLDRSGYTVIPGLVGMHDHLYYTASYAEQVGLHGEVAEPGLVLAELPYSAPRLYLAAGVTTMRSTGSVEPYTDLKIKQRIDAKQMPGPDIDVTAPYLEGFPARFAQMHELTGPDDARRLVDYWTAEGMTSFKAYMNVTRDELGAAIQQAHHHHLKLTGHLCSVTWHEAIALGIDNLEHGPVFTDTSVVPGKKPDVCPAPSARGESWAKVDMNGPAMQELIRDLVAHHVAVTSTLPVFESGIPGRPGLPQRILDALSPDAKASYLTARARLNPATPLAALLRKEMDFEVAFVKAGGLLLAGPDPTGAGGVLPGFGDQRELELLVEAGFTPLQAIEIGTKNGATYLGRQDRIGTLAPGKQADLVLIKGDPVKNIEDIEKVETVFKAGIGYDSAKLIESVHGQVGIR